MKLPIIYLAGAIRPDHREDEEWRIQFTKSLIGLAIVYNPMFGKERKDDQWTIFGVPSHDRMIVHHDFYMVDNADIVVFNLLAMKEGYHCIGTMTEFGRSTARTQIRYVIAPPDDASYPKIHPFIVQSAAHVFTTVEETLGFVMNVCAMLTISERSIRQVVQMVPQQQPGRIVLPNGPVQPQLPRAIKESAR